MISYLNLKFQHILVLVPAFSAASLYAGAGARLHQHRQVLRPALAPTARSAATPGPALRWGSGGGCPGPPASKGPLLTKYAG